MFVHGKRRNELTPGGNGSIHGVETKQHVGSVCLHHDTVIRIRCQVYNEIIS